MTLTLPFDNSYARLPGQFYTRQPPTPVADPRLIAVNEGLAAELGFDASALKTPEGVAVLAGNSVPKGADPLAQVYAGHQFGGWSPQLGDGRALLLGEIVDRTGQRRDVQLKGSGPTPYSRMGDGRAWLGPVLREYIVSEAMHALGIPTTRALAAVTTGETVFREAPLPGAVLTRVASSHIRVGTFQYFAARQDTEALKSLAAHVMDRHYPDAETPLDLLSAVIERQANLIALWMGVGFIHGVMNTDNAHIAGETIDYGPCAFMDAYQHDKVFSSIDRGGRYAYGNQPQIAVWNMAQLASALLPLIDPDLDTAIERATEVVNQFPALYRTAWRDVFCAKFGLTAPSDQDVDLITRFMSLLEESEADFTNTFRALANGASPLDGTEAGRDWYAEYRVRQESEALSADDQSALMQSTNPAVIPRNHRIEAAIQAGVSGDLEPFFTLLKVTASPYELSDAMAAYADPPEPAEEVRQTFCGT